MTTDKNIYTLTHVRKLTHPSLIDYMAGWGIPASTSKKYLKQLKLYNPKDKLHFLTLGMLNEDEGYEYRSSEVSGHVGGERDISFVRGLKVKPDNIHVFFDMNDFLAVVAREVEEAFIDDAIILHSLSLLHKVPPYLYQYDYKHLYSWMENNHNGRRARNKLSAFCASEPGLQHKPQNQFYSEYEDVNEWCARAKKLNL